ncbi:LamG domain-containing protein [Streptomyces sp. NPDC102473]|uniref:LamG domain-containing protein n=1 Tax=Streptomyces sp. NPDC102473 TaxID=3366180 RepID=UPI00380CC052
MSRRTGRGLALRAAVAASLAGAVLAAGLTFDAEPDLGKDGQAPVAASGPVQTESAASAAADTSGEPVEVLGLRSERREVFAQPDGTFEAREYTEPVRTIQAGTWVDIDETLVKREDGRWGPKAATVDLSFAGGAKNEPFVTLRRAGREISLTWPDGVLPAPRIEGDTATYAEVHPGVDLVVRAEADGFGHLLVVKTPEAAASPEIAEIELGLRTSGLKVTEDASGAIVAKDEAVDGTVFEAGRPTMWDSAATTESGARSSGRSAVTRSLAVAAEDGASQADPSLEGPGGGGRTAPLEVELSKDKLTLTPDQALLKDAETVWPVVIDPIQRTTSRTSWTGVMSGMPSEQDWKYSDSAGVGKCPTDYNPVSCNGVGVRRVLYTMPMSFYKDKQILGTSFSARVAHIYSASPTAEPIRLYRVGGKNRALSSSSDWNSTKDEWVDHLETVDKAISPTSCGSQANLHFESGASGELTGAVKAAAADGWASMTLGLRAADESRFAEWKRICGNAYLSVSYNNLPRQMSTAKMSSDPGGSCKWGSARPYAEEPPMLTTYASDPDHGSGKTDKVKVQFKVAWTPKGATAETSYTYDTSYLSPTATTPYRHRVKTTVPEGVVVYWSARAYDGDGWGPWSTDGDPQRCEFILDKTKPGKPLVNSLEYPSDSVEHDGVGTAGTFTFAPNPNDSVPDTDVVSFRYGFNSDADPTTAATPSKAGGPVSVTWTPSKWGRNWVEVISVDKAGNAGTKARYEFLVTEGKPAAAQWNLADVAGSGSAHDERGEFAADKGSGVTFGAIGPGGKADAAASFDGTENAYLDSVNTVLDTAKSFSVSAWVRPTDLSRDMTVVSQDGTGVPGFTLGYDTTVGTWAFGTSVTDVDTLGEWKAVARGTDGKAIVPVKDAWVLLTGVYDATASGGPQLHLYVNKTSVGTAQRRSVWKTYGSLQIGRSTAKSGYREHFKGDLAEVRVFDRVLPATQVAELMTIKPARKGYWQLDAVSGTTSAETGGGQALTLAGDARVYKPTPPDPDDPFASADPPALVGAGHLLLDGAGDYAATTAAPSSGAGSFTVSARAQLTAIDGTVPQTVLSLPGAAANRVQVRFRPDPDGGPDSRWELAVAGTDSASAAVRVFQDDQELPDTGGSGQHLAVVYDAFANEIRLYVEGQLADTAYGMDNTLWSTAKGLQVGRSALGSAENFAGAIDEVRAYDGAVDPAVVSQMSLLTAVPDM